MERIPNLIYIKKFRKEKVKLVIEQGLSIPEVEQKLSIHKSTISYWLRAYRKGNISVAGNSKKTVSETEVEQAMVKRELVQVRRENKQ